MVHHSQDEIVYIYIQLYLHNVGNIIYMLQFKSIFLKEDNRWQRLFNNRTC